MTSLLVVTICWVSRGTSSIGGAALILQGPWRPGSSYKVQKQVSLVKNELHQEQQVTLEEMQRLQ